MPAEAQDRSNDNVITQAEDGFGFSIGRESLGIYNADNTRGFSPAAAGNLRIDGLYFDERFALPSTLINSSSVKVGLSAQGYPFAAPSGIVDYSFRRPATQAGASIVTNVDSFGTTGVELTGSQPLSPALSVGYGATATRVEFPDGTGNFNHTESLAIRWQPIGAVEIMPFWSRNDDYDDEAGTYYVVAGRYLPKLAEQRHYEGPDWADYRYVGTNAGLLSSARMGRNWVVRLGVFRSILDVKRGFSNLLVNELPDGSGERLLFADPPSKSASTSGELRVTRSIKDGPRLHIFHFSIRNRNARREFGGSELIDLGPGRIGQKIDPPEPSEFHFGDVSHDRVRQTTLGIAYDGRWKNVGEVSFSLSQAHFHKQTVSPGGGIARTRSTPWLYNATMAANVNRSIILYAGYARGLEETGIAPPNAENRNEPLPVIITEQEDAGARIALGKNLTGVVGLFELTRPYFGYDLQNVFRRIGTVRNQGLEFSISGGLTPRLSVVAGGILARPRVAAENNAAGAIGPKPVGLPGHLFKANLDWKVPFANGLELDAAISHLGRAPATTDNLVFVPARARIDLGGRYAFSIARRSATFRLQIANVFNEAGYGVPSSGVYTILPGRFVQAYLTVDL